jgi:hypothetical protein
MQQILSAARRNLKVQSMKNIITGCISVEIEDFENVE